MKNIDEIRNYFIEEINQNELMSKKCKKVCEVSNYIAHMLILVSTVTGCVSISSFASLLGIALVIASSEVRLKICVITAGIRKCKSMTKKIKNKHDKIVLLAKSKLNSIEVLTFKVLINLNISHDDVF